jgi:SAM-dependent methyltransferase
VPLRPYDAVRYTTYPRIETHPDRLAAMGRLYGIPTAPVEACRVLEIGCGDGGNLIPMAYFLPHSHFYGIDLAGGAIAEGRRVVQDLELRNVELAERDLRDLGRDDGEFDYIVAHGLYSWIPPDLRDRLLDVCRERLAPHGIAYLSYNTWPGRHARHILREMLLYHLRGIHRPQRRLSEARRFLRLLQTPEARDLVDRPDDVLFHDDLALVNDPVWFRDFAAHAERHGLQYLDEAGTGPRVPLESEQHSDFFRMRSFRQSLVCRAEVSIHRDIEPGRMSGFLFSAGGDPVDAVTAALRDAFPLPVAYDELLPYGVDALLDHWRAGRVDLHVWDFPCEESVTERPRATRVARYEAARSHQVPSVCHHLVELTADDRELLLQLDGEHRVDAARIEWFAQMGLLDG